jgi:hypothetical protein
MMNLFLLNARPGAQLQTFDRPRTMLECQAQILIQRIIARRQIAIFKQPVGMDTPPGSGLYSAKPRSFHDWSQGGRPSGSY